MKNFKLVLENLLKKIGYHSDLKHIDLMSFYKCGKIN